MSIFRSIAAVFLLICWYSYKDRSLHATEVCLEAASTFNALLSKYQSAHALSLSNPHFIYLIFTAAIAHLSGYRQLENASTTTSLQTQLHLLNCLEAFKLIGQTWDLAERCWKMLDRLMDLEGMKPGEGENMTSMLGKRKRAIGEKDARGGSPSKRDSSISTTSSTLYDPTSLPPAYSSPSVPVNQNQNILNTWPSSSMSMPSSQTHIASASATANDIFFDPDFFSTTTGWLPEPNAPMAMSDSLGGMWTNDWDENFWARSFQMPLNVGGAGQMEGDRDFAMGVGALSRSG